MPRVTAVVGRQPIVDRDGRTVGYELLFRPFPSSRTAHDPDTSTEVDGDRMTNDVIFGALGIGIDRLTGGKTIFCNADRGVLTGRVPVSLPPRQTVIEVLETVTIDDEVVAGCRALKHAGYRLAADDFTWTADSEALLGLVDIVKIDLRMTPLPEVSALVKRCAKFGVRLLAEKIETAEELAACHELDFELFQGYLLGRPTTVSGTAVGPTRYGVLRLASAVLDDDVDYAAIERILRPEPELSYQLLQLAAVGRFGETRRTVRNLRQALVFVGLNRLRGWIPALVLRPAGPAIDTNLPTVLARARMAETLASLVCPRHVETAFTAGMFSAFDLLLGVPGHKLPELLEIPPGLREAIFDRDNPVGRLVGWVIDYQRDGRFPPFESGLDPSVVVNAASSAFGWATRHAKLIDDTAGTPMPARLEGATALVS